MVKEFKAIENPEKFFSLTEKDVFVRLYAFDMLVRHLHDSKNDKRKKERARVQVALDCVNKWINMGTSAYERSRNLKSDKTRSKR